MTKKQYIAPISEKVFPESLMEGYNPGKEGGIINSGSNIAPDHVICAPGRSGLKYL